MNFASQKRILSILNQYYWCIPMRINRQREGREASTRSIQMNFSIEASPLKRLSPSLYVISVAYSMRSLGFKFTFLVLQRRCMSPIELALVMENFWRASLAIARPYLLSSGALERCFRPVFFLLEQVKQSTRIVLWGLLIRAKVLAGRRPSV